MPAAVALIVYAQLGTTWWLLAALVLAPDLSMVGYLAGERVGALLYNLVHTTAGPAALALAGWLGLLPLGLELGAIWAAHIGLDRAAGFGLKHPSGFSDTHLDRV